MLHFKYVLKGCCPTHLFILLFIMFLVGCVETKTSDGSCVDALDCAPGEECSFGWCQERMRPKSCDEIVLNCTCAFQNQGYGPPPAGTTRTTDLCESGQDIVFDCDYICWDGTAAIGRRCYCE